MRNLLPAILVLATSVAHANPKYTRKPDLKIDPKISDRTKPIVPAKPTPSKPATADEAMLAMERADPIRQEQEAMLVQLVNDTPIDDPDKPDLMFRLAEHYAMQLRFWHLKAVELTLP